MMTTAITTMIKKKNFKDTRIKTNHKKGPHSPEGSKEGIIYAVTIVNV